MLSIHPLQGGSQVTAATVAGRHAVALLRRARGFAGDRTGVTSLEYAIMGSLIFAAVAGALYGYGGGLSFQLANTFGAIAGQL